MPVLLSFSREKDRLPGDSSSEKLNEELFLVTDRDIYISAEEVYIKVLCRDSETHKPSSVSRVAYISLLDHETVPVAQVKVWLDSSSGSGKFTLPETLPTGSYMISACTEWMRNSPPESYAYKLISVINPFINIDHFNVADNPGSSDTIPPPATSTSVAGTERLASGQSDGAHIYLEADRTVLHPREKVSVAIKARNSEGEPSGADIALSAFKSFAYDSLVHAGSFSKIKKSGESPGDIHERVQAGEVIFLPEPEGHIVTGAIYSTVTGEPLKSENMVLSFVGKTPDCHFAKTDDKGVFIFIINESGNQEIFVQPFDRELKDYYIELSSPFPEVFAGYETGQYYIDTAKLNEINNAIISMQVQALYSNTAESSHTREQQGYGTPFYRDPDHQIILADYIELTSLEEVFHELLLWAPVKSIAGHKRLTILNNIPDVLLLDDPFLIVDGIPAVDHEAVLAIPNTQVEKISLVNSRYYIADMCLEGIIDISTIQGNLKATGMSIPGLRQEFAAPLAGSDFQSPEYLTDDQKNSRIPDCRNTLYWNPGIRTDKNGEAIAEFYTSDEPGEYLIVAEGITDEGLHESASLLITVESK